jgi:hypothetical protein
MKVRAFLLLASMVVAGCGAQDELVDQSSEVVDETGAVLALCQSGSCTTPPSACRPCASGIPVCARCVTTATGCSWRFPRCAIW